MGQTKKTSKVANRMPELPQKIQAPHPISKVDPSHPMKKTRLNSYICYVTLSVISHIS